LLDEQQRVAELIHADKGQEAVAGLQAIFQTWQTIKDLVERGATLLDTDLSVVELSGLPEGETFSKASTRLLTHLRRVKTALGSQDWSALADVLQYDLCDEAQAWEKLLDALADHVGTLPPDTTVNGGTSAP
jgi:hypothetical protein